MEPYQFNKPLSFLSQTFHVLAVNQKEDKQEG